MREISEVLRALEGSAFRRRQQLGTKEREYIESKGMPAVIEHARAFIRDRLAPATPKNDGKQTPFRGHPVFVAQHATATCCRGCLEKWHKIPKGHELTSAEQQHVAATIEEWLSAQQRARN